MDIVLQVVQKSFLIALIFVLPASSTSGKDLTTMTVDLCRHLFNRVSRLINRNRVRERSPVEIK